MAFWLYPANTRFYDVFSAFGENETYWPIKSSVAVGDTVLIYLAAPFKQVGFVCEVVEIGLGLEQIKPFIQQYFKESMGSKKKPTSFMRLRVAATIPIEEESSFSYYRLKENGLSGMLMAPRKLDNNPQLFEYIIKVYDAL